MAIRYNTSIVRSGLTLQLDAANPKSYPGTGTTWIDLSGNGKNGTLTNGPTFSNNSIVFDGVDDYIQLPASNLVITSTSFSCFIWVNALATKSTGDQNIGGRFVTILRSSISSYFGFGLKGDNTDTVQIFIGSGTTFTYLNSGIVGTGFHNVGFTYDLALTKLKFYIDGSLKAEHTTTFSTPSVDAGFLAIGVGNTPYACKISNFSTYNRVLTDQEVQQNFEALRGRYGV